jgi:hypothetical protein
VAISDLWQGKALSAAQSIRDNASQRRDISELTPIPLFSDDKPDGEHGEDAFSAQDRAGKRARMTWLWPDRQ